MARIIEKWMSATKVAGSRWPALFALLALGGLHAALPSSLILTGSRWLLAVISVLIVPIVVSHYKGAHTTNQVLGYVLNGVVTASMIISLALLIRALPLHLEKPEELLRSAAALWLANILVFASWYWRLDAGGPHKRAKRGSYVSGAFLFPQMTMAPDQTCCGLSGMVTKFCGLPFSGLQYIYSFLPDGCSSPITLGKGLDDATVDYLLAGYCSSCCTGGEHPVNLDRSTINPPLVNL